MASIFFSLTCATAYLIKTSDDMYHNSKTTELTAILFHPVYLSPHQSTNTLNKSHTKNKCEADGIITISGPQLFTQLLLPVPVRQRLMQGVEGKFEAAAGLVEDGGSSRGGRGIISLVMHSVADSQI